MHLLVQDSLKPNQRNYGHKLSLIFGKFAVGVKLSDGAFKADGTVSKLPMKTH